MRLSKKLNKYMSLSCWIAISRFILKQFDFELEISLHDSLCKILPNQLFNPFTHKSYQDRISTHNFNTISSTQVIRMGKNTTKGIPNSLSELSS